MLLNTQESEIPIFDAFLGCQQVKKIELNDGRVLYCAWISRDPEEEGEGGRSMSSFALASSFNSSEYSVTSIAEVSCSCSKFRIQLKVRSLWLSIV